MKGQELKEVTALVDKRIDGYFNKKSAEFQKNTCEWGRKSFIGKTLTVLGYYLMGVVLIYATLLVIGVVIFMISLIFGLIFSFAF